MAQRPLGRNRRQILSGNRSKWAARRRQDDALDFVLAARPQTLVDGIVLAIDWQQVGAGGARCRHHRLSSGHKNLFIGKSHATSGLHRPIGRIQANDTDGGGHQDIEVDIDSGGKDAIGTANATRCVAADTAQCAAQVPQRVRVGYRDELGPEFQGLADQLVHVPPGRERNNGNWRLDFSDDLECAAPDRSGGAQQ